MNRRAREQLGVGVNLSMDLQADHSHQVLGSTEEERIRKWEVFQKNKS